MIFTKESLQYEIRSMHGVAAFYLISRREIGFCIV